MAPNHQHFFNARLDLDIDGEQNTAQEVNTLSVPPGPENPHGNAFFAEVTPMLTEAAAQRNTNPLSARFWRVVNESRKNELGGPVGYRLCPGENVLPHAQPDAAVLKRAGFLTRNLWVTPYQAERALSDRRLSQPEHRRRRPSPMDAERPQHGRDRPGRLVHFRPDPHPARRGLARDAGQLGRLSPPAGRVLRRQPRTRPSSSTRVNNGEHTPCDTKCASRSRSVLGSVPRPATSADDNTAPEGFVSLFNGKDLTGWKIPEGDGGHWKVVDGVIDYDAGSEARATRPSGARSSIATSSSRSIGGSRKRRSSTRTFPTSCPTARTPRTSTARS